MSIDCWSFYTMECYISNWLLQILFSYAIKKAELAILASFFLTPSSFLRTYSRSYLTSWRPSSGLQAFFGPVQGRTCNLGFVLLYAIKLSSDLFKVDFAILAFFFLTSSSFLRTYSRSYLESWLPSSSRHQALFWPQPSINNASISIVNSFRSSFINQNWDDSSSAALDVFEVRWLLATVSNTLDLRIYEWRSASCSSSSHSIFLTY